MRKLLLLALPLLLSFSTCGHRGEPLPPLAKEPSTPKVSDPIQDFDRPLLSWKSVNTYRDGRRLPDPKRVKYVVSINFGEREVETKSNFLLDVPIGEGERRCYSVKSIYAGRESILSEPKCIVGRSPIKEVPLFTVRGGDGKVVIEVKNPLLPVEVFRNQSFPFIEPYARFEGKRFVDRNVENGRKYTYRLRFFNGKLKGKLSGTATAVPEDRIPPLPPYRAYLMEGCVVVWDPSPSSDVVYYIVETDKFKLKADGIYLKLPECNRNVSVVAVDKAGNQSKPIKAEVLR